MFLYYSKKEDCRNGYAIYYLNGDLKNTAKVTHALKNKDSFLVDPPDDIIYVGEGKYGWSHRMNSLRKLK